MDKCSRDATTFSTPFGRFRYLTNPQGQKVSRDAYTVRYDKILMDFKWWVCQVNDTLVWDKGFESLIWYVMEFLELMGKMGLLKIHQNLLLGKRS